MFSIGQKMNYDVWILSINDKLSWNLKLIIILIIYV